MSERLTDGKLASLLEDENTGFLVRWLIEELQERRKAERDGTASDGYHTFNELYDHRITLFIALCSEIDARTSTGDYVWRSKLHSDGTMFDGWFVMGIGRKPGEQITYHLPISRWVDTDWLGHEDERAPEFDGHTSADALQRLRRYFT